MYEREKERSLCKCFVFDCTCVCFVFVHERVGERFSLAVVYEKVIEKVFVCETEREM